MKLYKEKTYNRKKADNAIFAYMFAKAQEGTYMFPLVAMQGVLEVVKNVANLAQQMQRENKTKFQRGGIIPNRPFIEPGEIVLNTEQQEKISKKFKDAIKSGKCDVDIEVDI